VFFFFFVVRAFALCLYLPTLRFFLLAPRGDVLSFSFCRLMSFLLFFEEETVVEFFWFFASRTGFCRRGGRWRLFSRQLRFLSWAGCVFVKL